MRHKIFKYMKTYQEFIFNVSGGSFFKGQNKFPRKPASLIVKVGLNTSFEFFFYYFSASPIEKQINMMSRNLMSRNLMIRNLMNRNW